MRTQLMILFFALILAGLCTANPLPDKMVAYINVDPPQIGIWSAWEDDLSGKLITTSQCTATINEGVTVPENFGFEPLILDSSNTSGFVICSENDYVEIEDDFYCEGASFGQYRWYPAPITGHAIKRYYYVDWDMPSYVMCFEDAAPDYGETNVVINEINANCNWGIKSNFIELYNTGDQPVDLSGWRIVVDEIYEIPDGVIIPAGGFYVIDGDQFPEQFDLSFPADNVYLIKYTQADGYEVVDQVGWSSDHGENISFMRYPDGDLTHDDWWWMAAYLGHDDGSSETFENGFPTRSAANRHVCPGFVVIGARADSIDEITAHIHWTDPIWDDTFTASVLVMSNEGHPSSIYDGEMVYTGADQEYTEEFMLPDLPYYYTVFARDYGGQYSVPTEESQAFIQFNVVSIEEVNLPEHTGHLNCYPNPFNAQTTISFSLTRPGDVEISIYDITGRFAETVVNGSYATGEYSIIWNADEYSSGIYFARLQNDSRSHSEKLVLLK